MKIEPRWAQEIVDEAKLYQDIKMIPTAKNRKLRKEIFEAIIELTKLIGN